MYFAHQAVAVESAGQRIVVGQKRQMRLVIRCLPLQRILQPLRLHPLQLGFGFFAQRFFPQQQDRGARQLGVHVQNRLHQHPDHPAHRLVGAMPRFVQADAVIAHLDCHNRQPAVAIQNVKRQPSGEKFKQHQNRVGYR